MKNANSLNVKVNGEVGESQSRGVVAMGTFFSHVAIGQIPVRVLFLTSVPVLTLLLLFFLLAVSADWSSTVGAHAWCSCCACTNDSDLSVRQALRRPTLIPDASPHSNGLTAEQPHRATAQIDIKGVKTAATAFPEAAIGVGGCCPTGAVSLAIVDDGLLADADAQACKGYTRSDANVIPTLMG